MLLFTTLGGNVREPLDVDIHTKRSLHFHPEWQTRRMSRCLHRWFQGLPRPMCRLCCRVFIANVKAPTCSPLHLYDYQRSQFPLWVSFRDFCSLCKHRSRSCHALLPRVLSIFGITDARTPCYFCVKCRASFVIYLRHVISLRRRLSLLPN